MHRIISRVSYKLGGTTDITRAALALSKFPINLSGNMQQDSIGQAPAAVRQRHEAARAIFIGGLVAGILDISDAFVFLGLHGVQPWRILQGIASGAMGPSSFGGGWKTAALGLGLHFLIAFTAAAVYYAASRYLSFLRTRPIVCGLFYGAAIYVFMNYVVLPLSAFSKNPRPPSAANLLNGVLAVVLLVGLPIAFLARSKPDTLASSLPSGERAY